MDKNRTTPQIPKKGKSKRNRCRGRQLRTYENKLTKLKTLYNRLFKTSQKSKETYLTVAEGLRKPKNKVFFCDKYIDFQKFLEINKLRQIGKGEERPESTFNKKDARKKMSVWGIK